MAQGLIRDLGLKADTEKTWKDHGFVDDLTDLPPKDGKKSRKRSTYIALTPEKHQTLVYFQREFNLFIKQTHTQAACVAEQIWEPVPS